MGGNRLWLLIRSQNSVYLHLLPQQKCKKELEPKQQLGLYALVW